MLPSALGRPSSVPRGQPSAVRRPVPTATPPAAAPASRPAARRRATSLAVTLLVLATLAAYHNSFGGPFVFDDLPAIRDNPTIRQLSTAFFPPSAEGNTVGGRPLLNLSFALNYALGGLAVTGYHALNLLIHVGAGLLLFGLVRRLIRVGASLENARSESAPSNVGLPLVGRPDGDRRLPASAGGPATRAGPTPPRFGTTTPLHADATVFATAAALVWLVHPLQTESVTYLVQRAESLAGFFVLLALYAFVRAVGFRGNGVSVRWLIVSATACIAGVATKESVVVAPLAVLLCDRAFFAGSFSAALRARRGYYAALALSWLIAAALVIGAGGRGGSAGFATPISAWTYALTQCQAIVHYLRLVVWPSPLVFDYGSPVVTSLGAAAPYAFFLLAAMAGAVYALFRWPRVGTAVVAFFLFLAPSSSVVPVATQTLAEHRIYLPLAALAVLVAGALHRLGGRAGLAALAILALPLTFTTTRRNLDYRSAEVLWTDTVAKRPDNPRAHNNLGLLLAGGERLDEAIAHFETAVRLFPRNPDALNNLGLALTRAGRLPEAIARLEASLQLAPESAPAHLNLADALVRSRRPSEAIAHFDRAAQLRPLDADALTNHGAALLRLERPAEALRPLEAALALAPDHARAHYNLANALVALQRMPEAIEHYRASVRSAPDYVAAHANLGNALMITRRYDEAADAFEAAARLRPADARLRAAAEQARTLGQPRR